MSRRDLRRSTEQGARNHRKIIALGVAVPAVVSMGALPAFAAHSSELDTTVDGDLDARDDVLSLDAEFADQEELDYDPFDAADNGEGSGDAEGTASDGEGSGDAEGTASDGEEQDATVDEGADSEDSGAIVNEGADSAADDEASTVRNG